MDRLGFVVLAVIVEGTIIVRGEGRRGAPGLLVEEGGHSLLRGRRAVGAGEKEGGGHGGSSLKRWRRRPRQDRSVHGEDKGAERGGTS